MNGAASRNSLWRAFLLALGNPVNSAVKMRACRRISYILACGFVLCLSGYELSCACFQILNFFTVCKRSCGKVMFSQACVKNSVHRGMYPSMHWGGGVADTTLADTPPGRDPPWVDTPGQTPPQRPLQRTVRILLECILVCSTFFIVKNHENDTHVLISKF